MSEGKQNRTDVKELIVVEELTIPVVIRYLGPYLARHQNRGAIYPVLYYIDADASGSVLGRLICRLSGLKCQRLQFKLADIIDDQGRLLELRMFYRDMFEILEAVVKNPVLSGIFQHPAVKNNSCLTTYLKKQTMGGSLDEGNDVLRLLHLIQISYWQAGKLGNSKMEKVLF